MQSFVLRSIFFTLYAASSLAFTVNPYNLKRGVAPVSCGTPPPPAALSNQIATFNAPKRLSAQAHAPVSVKAYFHVVTSTAAAGTWTQSQLNQQINVMNNVYQPFNIAFTLAGWDSTVKDAWSDGTARHDMKVALHKGTYADLNIYFLSDYVGTKGNSIGVCSYPTGKPSSDTKMMDGCLVRVDTLPGGARTHYNTGLNAAHETGHWFGIHHPFDSHNCTTDGDGISDTPMQSTESFGCDTSKDSCPSQPGMDNIHNIMDYSYESCKTGFTAGQGAVMLQLWDSLRAGSK